MAAHLPRSTFHATDPYEAHQPLPYHSTRLHLSQQTYAPRTDEPSRTAPSPTTPTVHVLSTHPRTITTYLHPPYLTDDSFLAYPRPTDLPNQISPCLAGTTIRTSPLRIFPYHYDCSTQAHSHLVTSAHHAPTSPLKPAHLTSCRLSYSGLPRDNPHRHDCTARPDPVLSRPTTLLEPRRVTPTNLCKPQQPSSPRRFYSRRVVPIRRLNSTRTVPYPSQATNLLEPLLVKPSRNDYPSLFLPCPTQPCRTDQPPHYPPIRPEPTGRICPSHVTPHRHNAPIRTTAPHNETTDLAAPSQTSPPQHRPTTLADPRPREPHRTKPTYLVTPTHFWTTCPANTRLILPRQIDVSLHYSSCQRRPDQADNA